MADEPKKKDHWDKLGIVLQPVGGLLTAMAVAYVGVTGSRILEDRQSRETNARLYSELMSRREEAESSLRKDMLVAIIEKYLASSENDRDAKVLQLERLADNFHDSLDVRPLFFDPATFDVSYFDFPMIDKHSPRERVALRRGADRLCRDRGGTHDDLLPGRIREPEIGTDSLQNSPVLAVLIGRRIFRL